MMQERFPVCVFAGSHIEMFRMFDVSRITAGKFTKSALFKLQTLGGKKFGMSCRKAVFLGDIWDFSAQFATNSFPISSVMT